MIKPKLIHWNRIKQSDEKELKKKHEADIEAETDSFASLKSHQKH